MRRNRRQDTNWKTYTETTSEKIKLVQSIINDDPCITIDELEAQINLSHGTIQQIVSDHLNLRKITARYVPKHLNDFQKAERVRICKENLAKFESGAGRLCGVVTGDESWFHHTQIGRKSSNSAWFDIVVFLQKLYLASSLNQLVLF